MGMDAKPLLVIGAIVGIILLAVVFVAATAILSYNNLTNLSLKSDLAWSKVETVYQERFDLIPNIAATVKSETGAETSLLRDLADARSNYMNAKTVDDKVAASNQLDASFAKVLLLTENYPNLQFSKGYQDLRVTISGQENRIRVERNNYNEAVTEYNLAVRSFPSNLYAMLFGFKERQTFKSVSGAETAPDMAKILNVQ